MKYITLTLLGLSLLANAENINQEKMAKDMLLKMEVPMLKVAKQGLVCMESTTEKEYLSCTTKAQKDFLNTDLGKALGSGKVSKPTSELWKDKEQRKEAIVKFKKTIETFESEIRCVNNPKTKHVEECIQR